MMFAASNRCRFAPNDFDWRLSDLTFTVANTPGTDHIPTINYFIHWPIFSVPKVPMPFSRKAKTIRFSFRRPTLKV